jgi:outer membrane protein
MKKLNNCLRFTSLAFITFFTITQTDAQADKEKRIITFDEAISLGVNHSNQLKIDSFNLRMANEKLNQNKSRQLPQLIISSSYLRISDNITPFSAAFPDGVVVLNPQILNQSYNSIQVRQLILGGGKVKNTNKIIELDKKTISFDLSISEKELKYQIAYLYYNLFVVKQTKNILKSNIELLNSQKKDAKNLLKQGIILENDILKIEIAVSNIQSNLSDLENTIILFKNNLLIATGLPLDLNIDIPETLPQNPTNVLTLDNAIKTSLQNRKELKNIEIRKEQALLSNKIAKGNYLPTITGIGSFNYDQPNQRVFPNQASFNGTWYAGIAMNWNLTELATTHNYVNESKYLIEKVTLSTNQIKEGIQIEVNADYNNYLLAKEKIEIANQVLTQAKENFRIEQNKFNENSSSATDFLNANALLINAEINLTTAISNADLAYKKLLKSIN